MTPDEQSQKFRETVRELTDAGELNPTEADAAFDKLMANVKTEKADSQTD